MLSKNPTAKSIAIAQKKTLPIHWLALLPGLAVTFVVALTAASWGESHETVTKSHGYSRFGELKYPADFTHLDYVNPNAPKGGEISTWSQGSFDSIQRYAPKGEFEAASDIFFEDLMSGTLDEADALYCLLCETLEYPDSLQWVIFNLREDIKFSDGTPATASDIVFSHYILREKGIASLAQVFKDIINVEALNDRQVKFSFTEGLPKPILSEQIKLAAGTPMFSEAWWSGTDKDGNPRDFGQGTLEAPLGTGAYILGEMDPGRTISYVLNPDYWGTDHPLKVGHNNFETIRYEYYGDPVAALEGFKAGNYRFRNESSSIRWATAYDFPAVDSGWVVKQMIPDGRLASAQAWFFNMRRERFQDPRVREAVGYLFNFEWSNRTLFFDLYTRVSSLWGNSDMEAFGPPSAEELEILKEVAEFLPESVMTAEAVIPPVSSERQLDRKNLRAANRLLDEAGWTVGADGMRVNADGERLKMQILAYSPDWDRINNPLIENMRRAGIDAELLRVDVGTFLEKRRTLDFDIIGSGIRNSLTPGLGLRQWFSSDSAANETSDGRNLAGVSNEGIDILLERAIASATREELTLNVRVLDRALRSLKFWVPQWFKADHTVAYWDIYSRPETPPPYGLGAFTIWWYDEQKAAKLKDAGAL